MVTRSFACMFSRLSLVAIIALMPYGSSLPAQRNPFPVRPTPAPAPAATAERAALNYIQWVASRSKIPFYSIDARRLAPGQGDAKRIEGGGHVYGRNLAYLGTQSAEPLYHLAKVDSFEVVSAQRATLCRADPILHNCLRDSRFRLLTFSMPDITGATATIEVVIYGYVAPKKLPPGTKPTPASLGGGAQHSLFFKLEQRDGLWHVIDNRWVGP